MDLAATLGQSVGVLSQSMSEREFIRWQHYSNKRLLPWRRMEWYLAQLTHWVARTMGGVDLGVEAFLMQPYEPPEDDEDETLQQAIEAFQFKPVNVKE